MALQLDAALGSTTDDLLRRTVGLLNNNSNYTMAGWIKLTSDTNRINVIFYFTNPSGGCDFLAIAADGVTLQWTHQNSTGVGTTSFGSSLTPGTWYHVAIVRPSMLAGVKVYLNGVLDFTSSALGSTVRGLPTKLDVGGGDPDGSSPFAGTLAYWRAWQSQSGPSEMIAEMNSVRAVKTFSLYADWPFSTDGTDISGQNHPLTLRGTPTVVAGPAVPQTATLPAIATGQALYVHALVPQGDQLAVMPFINAGSIQQPTLQRGYPHIDARTEAQDAIYEYRGILATEVEVSYYPRETYAGVLWATKATDPSTVDAHSTREIVVSPETEEGYKIVPFTVDDYFTGGSTYSAATDPVTNDLTPLVIAAIHREGQQLRLTFQNTTNTKVILTVSIHGTGYYTKDKQTLVVRDMELLEANGGRRKPVRSDLSLVADETEAEEVALSLLNTLKNQTDGVYELTYRFGDDAGRRDLARMQKVVAIRAGSVITVTEDQSMVERAPYLVLSENFDTDGKAITITHRLLPIELTE